METHIHYAGMVDRAIKVKQAEGAGLVMIQDNFDPGWIPGTDPSGTMTFTDEPPQAVPVPPVRDPLAELDALKDELRAKKLI